MDNFLGIFVLILVVGLNIFNSRKKREAGHTEVEGDNSLEQPMTWEEMERQYGIEIQRKDPETVNAEPTSEDRNEMATNSDLVTIKEAHSGEGQQLRIKQTSERRVVTKRVTITTPVKSKKNLKNKTSLQKAARNGFIWSELMQPPLALRRKQ